MLPKEFAGTVIKVTKSGVIKSIKAVESSARGLTSNNGAGEAGPRGAIQCLSSISGSKIRRHNPLPRGHPASSSVQTLSGRGGRGRGQTTATTRDFHLQRFTRLPKGIFSKEGRGRPRLDSLSRDSTKNERKNRGVNDEDTNLES